MMEFGKEYYKECLHQVKELILFLDQQGLIINWNKAVANELGYDSDELYQLPLERIMNKELADQYFYGRDNQDVGETITIYRKNETCFLAKVRMLTVKKDGIFKIAFLENVEELSLLQNEIVHITQQLEHANQVEERFLANVTHELRTPLNGVRGMVTLLKDSKVTQQQLSCLEVIETSVSNMEQLINDLLDSIKVRAGIITIGSGSFYLKAWADGIANLYATLAKQKGLVFDYSYNLGLDCPVVGDELRLQQVVTNLLSNALKFTEEGKIHLDVSITEERMDSIELFVTVSDTGIGFKEEDKKRLFTSFTQADSSITRKYGGTGLGLSICKEIITTMGGTIDGKSEYGKGSSFYFHLPLKKGMVTKETKEKDQNTLVRETTNLNQVVEQLMISMDLGSYDKAEQFAHTIKEMEKEVHKETAKLAFRIELALRKRDLIKAKEHFLELDRRINERDYA